MWLLLALAAKHPSPHGFRSGNKVPVHAVCESHVGSLFVVAPANENKLLSTKPALQNPSEVSTLRFDHIETNTTPPSWLTSIPHKQAAGGDGKA
tara:strand:+ start:291 stop:572 length:282 start_codon:yes stop_codon:yes gene_type:complete